MTITLYARDIVAIVLIISFMIVICFTWLKAHLQNNINSFWNDLIKINEQFETLSTESSVQKKQIIIINKDFRKEVRQLKKFVSDMKTQTSSNKNKKQTSIDWNDDLKETNVFKPYVPFKIGD